MTNRPVTPLDPGATGATHYADEVVSLLGGLLRQVVMARQPDVLPYVDGIAALPDARRPILLNCLKAHGIWFQLLNIAEENAAMRLRRETELSRLTKKAGGRQHVAFTTLN